MSIKDLFNSNKNSQISKAKTTEDVVETIESEDFIEAKRKEFDQFVPPIDFSTASNFAKFGSAELYYEKSFEYISQFYPYDGTLAEKVEFENSSSYLDKYVFENLYPRTNGYVTFREDAYITILGGPHTASIGMEGRDLDQTFDRSMIYNEDKRRTSAFEFRGEDGIAAEFWLKVPSLTLGAKNIFHISGTVADGEIILSHNNADLSFEVLSGSNSVSSSFAEITDTEWNHYAVSVISSSSGIGFKGYKNGQLVTDIVSSSNIPHILPTTGGINMRVGQNFDGSQSMSGSLDEFRFWKKARTSEEIYSSWFVNIGGGTNKHDANVDLGLYLKFNEGITGYESIDSTALDYSGRINNGTIVGYSSGFRSTGSAITEKLAQSEWQDPIIYSSHPDVIAKKAEMKTSGSLADLSNSSMLYRYMPSWMQEEDEQNGKQLKYVCQIMASHLDTLWHQIDYLNKIHDKRYIGEGEKALPFAQMLLENEGFYVPNLFSDATLLERFRNIDDNEVFQSTIQEVKNTIYQNIYNNITAIYKTKGTEKSFRNFFNSIGLGSDVVRLNKYADDSTFVLRNNYEFISLEKRYLDFNANQEATIYSTSSVGNIYIPGDTYYSGSFTLEGEVFLPAKPKIGEAGFSPFLYLTSSIFGFHSGSDYTHPSTDYPLSIYAIRSEYEANVNPNSSQMVKFLLTGSGVELTSDYFSGQYEGNKWNLAVRVRHENYPYANVTGNVSTDYVVEFYGVQAEGNDKLNSFALSSSIDTEYFLSDKIFYAGAHKTNF
jgi:hypothetical protein